MHMYYIRRFSFTVELFRITWLDVRKEIEIKPVLHVESFLYLFLFMSLISTHSLIRVFIWKIPGSRKETAEISMGWGLERHRHTLKISLAYPYHLNLWKMNNKKINFKNNKKIHKINCMKCMYENEHLYIMNKMK